MRAIADTECAMADYNTAMAAVKKDKSKAKTLGLPARIALVKNATIMITQLQQTITNVGELGTYMNIESHSLIEALADQGLAAALGEPLAEAAMPPKVYSGKTGRLIVPTVRTTADKAAVLPLRALVLAAEACTAVTITFKPLAHSSSQGAAGGTVAMKSLGREVYEADIPAQSADYEYFVSATCGKETLVFPPGAPAIQQSVVLL